MVSDRTILGLVCSAVLVLSGNFSFAQETAGANLLVPSAMQGTWDNNKGIAKHAYSSEGARLEGSQSVQVKYNVSGNKQESGFWFGLIGRDLSKYAEVSFWVKGEKGGEEFKVGIKDSSYFEDKMDIKDLLPGGVTTQWQKVSIPLADFKSIKNWFNMDNFSITFRNDYGQPFTGTIYVDGLAFSGERTGVERQPVIKWESPELSTMTDDQFLDLVEHSACMFFWEEANPENGLIKDNCTAFMADNAPMASIASVGFGLPALCVAVDRGWLPKDKVEQRIITTLKFFRDRAECVHGFYYHFLDMRSGERWGGCELSSIDTTLLMAGVVYAGEYFKGTEVEKLAKELYDRVDWAWMMDNGTTPSMGWFPEKGFLPYRWSGYTSEHLVLYFMGIGSTTHPMSPDSWGAFSRGMNTYKEYRFSGPPALFTHQYSHCFVDFKGKEDRFMDYQENSVQATLANRQWCIDNMTRSKSYGPDCWGLTACDGPDGYKAYGAPNGENDGTVSPTAAISSIVFTPDLSIKAAKFMYSNYKDKIWGKYGFVDSFNWDRKWVSNRYIGIDQGPIVLMIENYRTGKVWKTFMQNENIKTAMKLCNFTKPKKVIDSVDLSGKWYLRTGDDFKWSKLKSVDKEWKQVTVPAGWETQGFDNYDGYAWYWYSFKLPKEKKSLWNEKGAKVLLRFGGIDDCDMTFLNKNLVGQSGLFPPKHQSVWEKQREYAIPLKMINFKSENVIAVRVYDSGRVGGIYKGPVEIKVVKEETLE
ncbi:MAG: glucoamylase family protein [Candidatus Omnitrophica bacterium]|nr:glucoamylase family protein [Candidatus Omnitrophota bacterium]